MNALAARLKASHGHMNALAARIKVSYGHMKARKVAFGVIRGHRFCQGARSRRWLVTPAVSDSQAILARGRVFLRARTKHDAKAALAATVLWLDLSAARHAGCPSHSVESNSKRCRRVVGLCLRR